MRYNLILSILCFLLVQHVSSQRRTHPVCKAGFEYVYINSKVGWVGIGSAWTTQAEKIHNITLEMHFATVPLKDTTYLGELRINHFHRLRTLNAASRWNVLYEINFPIQEPLPDVIKTILNGDTLCDDPDTAKSTEKPEQVKLLLTYNDYTKKQQYTASFLKKI